MIYFIVFYCILFFVFVINCVLCFIFRQGLPPALRVLSVKVV